MVNEKIIRKLSDKFIGDLKNEDGILYSLLKRVKDDHTLTLAIRNDYINIYYRGGSILKLTQLEDGYSTEFNKGYNKQGDVNVPDLPDRIDNKQHCKEWVETFAKLKEIMDYYLTKKTKLEREFQQLIFRENNIGNLASNSEYFFTDVEYTVDEELSTQKKARFDMLGVKWPSTERKKPNAFIPVLFEIKYGDRAMKGEAGILDHLRDIKALMNDTEKYNDLVATAESQFNQLDELGLINFKKCKNWKSASIDRTKKHEIEVVFVFINTIPRSVTLKSVIDDIDIEEFKDCFNLRFFVSTFAGYGMHDKNMLTHEQFKDLLISIENSQIKKL